MCQHDSTTDTSHLQPACYLSLLTDDGGVVIEPQHIVKQDFKENIRNSDEIVVFLRFVEGVRAFLRDFILETHDSNVKFSHFHGGGDAYRDLGYGT
jgi:hypothetical protein